MEWKVKRNIITNFIGKISAILISFICIPFYIKFMGIEAYGLIGFFMVLLAMLNVLDVGFSTTINREMARLSSQQGKGQEMRDLLQTLQRIYWLISLIIGVIIVIMSSAIAKYWIKPDALSVGSIRYAVVLMGLILVLRFPSLLYLGGLVGLQHQVIFNIISISIALLRGLGAVFVLWLVSPTIQAFFIWQFFVSGLETSIYAKYLWKKLPLTNKKSQFQKGIISTIWRFAFGITGISVMSLIIKQLDKVILSKVVSLELFGYYSLAVIIATSLYYLVSPIFMAIFPRFSQLVALKDEAGLKDLYHKGCQLISVTILPLAIVISFFSSEVLLLWTRNPIIAEKINLLVSILIIGTALNCLMSLPYSLQLAYGWTKLTFYMNLISLIILGPLIYYMVMHYGLLGAGFGWLILNIGYILIPINIMHTRLLKNEKWRWYLVDVGIPLVSSLASVGFWRIFIAPNLSKYPLLLLMSALLFTFAVAAIATPCIRSWIFRQISERIKLCPVQLRR